MRTICYQPGPLKMPDLSGLDIKANEVLTKASKGDSAPKAMAELAIGDVDATKADDNASESTAEVPELDVLEKEYQAADGPVVAAPPVAVAVACA